MKFFEHISAPIFKFSSMYGNQLLTPVESTMFEKSSKYLSHLQLSSTSLDH